ncbi:MAG: hypothetical protein Q9186_004555 [Xanthomendoza sp. 1 TL-2023]
MPLSIGIKGNRPLLLPLNASIAPASPLVSLQTVTATGSPIDRSKSTHLARVKELLTPITPSKSSCSSTSSSPIPSSNTSTLNEALKEDVEARIEAGVQKAESHIQFFARHPEDTTNPLTFLDGNSGAGTGDTGVYANWKAGRRLGKSSSSSHESPPRDLYTPPQACPSSAGSSALVSDDGEEFNGSPPGLIALPTQRKYTGDGRRRFREKEVMLRTRPVTLNEMPGRFRGTETCWYCSDGDAGRRCDVCGAVVRKASPEIWG